MLLDVTTPCVSAAGDRLTVHIHSDRRGAGQRGFPGKTTTTTTHRPELEQHPPPTRVGTAPPPPTIVGEPPLAEAPSSKQHGNMANIAVQRIKREFKEVLKSEEVSSWYIYAL